MYARRRFYCARNIEALLLTAGLIATAHQRAAPTVVETTKRSTQCSHAQSEGALTQLASSHTPCNPSINMWESAAPARTTTMTSAGKPHPSIIQRLRALPSSPLEASSRPGRLLRDRPCQLDSQAVPSRPPFPPPPGSRSLSERLALPSSSLWQERYGSMTRGRKSWIARG